MSVKHGNLSINSENIFPIIKKWLYSDHDIFAREMISNGCDAITKLKKLEVMGDYTFPDNYKPSIRVIVNPDDKTLQFIDNGIGMTADEVEEYITQIAFSGATEFLEKYKDKTTDDQMIGHFGLGFYSAFMVADEVHIDTLSYQEGAEPVHWSCDGGTEYEIQTGNRTETGTCITLFLNEQSVEFANEYRMREVIEKYCSFMPVNIYLSKEGAPQEYETIDESDLKEDGWFKMNPPLRGKEDREALIEGLRDGTVECIATDHAPHSAEEKSRGLEKSAFGIVGLETAFPILYTELVKKGAVELETILALLTDRPRARFRIPLGTDFSVWDLNAEYTIDPGDFATMGRATPFAGRRVYGKCLATWYSAKRVF